MFIFVSNQMFMLVSNEMFILVSNKISVNVCFGFKSNCIEIRFQFETFKSNVYFGFKSNFHWMFFCLFQVKHSVWFFVYYGFHLQCDISSSEWLAACDWRHIVRLKIPKNIRRIEVCIPQNVSWRIEVWVPGLAQQRDRIRSLLGWDCHHWKSWRPHREWIFIQN